MLLKMFVPIFEVTKYCNASTVVKPDGFVNYNTIFKIVPLSGKIKSNYGDLVAKVYCGDTGTGYITADILEALTRALR